MRLFNKIMKIISHNKIMNLITAILFYLYLSITNTINVYSLSSILVLVFLIIGFYHVDFNYIKNKKSILLFSIMFASLSIFGSVLYNILDFYDKSIFLELLNLKNILSFLSLVCFYYAILGVIITKALDIKLKANNSIIKNKKIIFLISFIFIILCWMPYFLHYYPGNLSPDSFEELEYIVNNFNNLSDHHPVLHILFIALPFKVGMALFKNITSGVAMATIFQMISMALIFASSICFLHNRKVRDWMLLLLLVFYALLPMNAYYSVIMWKDVIFAGVMLLLIMQCIKIYEYYKNNQLTLKKVIPFIIISLLCVFFRNNAIYMYIVMLFFSFFILKKSRKVMLVSYLIVFFVYVLVKYPLFNSLNITKSNSTEYVSIPLQQVSRMVVKDANLTDNEKEIISNLMPIKRIKETYNYRYVDSMKFDSEYNNQFLENNKKELFELWLNLCLKNLDVAIESFFGSNLGYWYPGVEYHSIIDHIYDNEYGLANKSLVPQHIGNFIDRLSDKKIPFLSLEWNVALYFWIILIVGYMSYKRKGLASLLPFIPILGIWLTLIIASPIFCEFRYAYNVFVCTPLIIYFPFIGELNEKK